MCARVYGEAKTLQLDQDQFCVVGLLSVSVSNIFCTHSRHLLLCGRRALTTIESKIYNLQFKSIPSNYIANTPIIKYDEE